MSVRSSVGQATGHIDTFCADLMPSPQELPVIFRDLPNYKYPDWINCATELLDKRVEAGDGERIAFVSDSESWSYRRLRDTSNRIANVLIQDFDIVPGNRVLLRGPNHPMLVACWFGVIKAGGIAVTTSPLLRAREIISVVDKAQISLTLCDARHTKDCCDAFAKPEEPTAIRVRIVEFNSDSSDSLDSRMARKSPTFENCRTAAEDVVIVAFTSGSTGQAKGTMHTHRDLLAAADCFPRYALQQTRDDIFIGSPPLAFTYALGGLLLFPMRIGARTVLLEEGSPRHLLEGIARHRASVCFTAPTAYRAMLKAVTPGQTKTLRKCVSAGENLPLATFEAWREATGLKIIDGIGSTEMLHMFISAPEDEIRPGATGKPMPGYEAKIIRPDGTGALPGESGRLAVRGITGCKYLDNPSEQAKYVKNGWNFTGDSFRMDEDGYFWFEARTDDLIISSGYNISGVEVENVLLEHAAVQECAVVGVPDSERGHVVKAFVVTASGHTGDDRLKKELQDFVKAQIAPFKYPRAMEFVAALPRTATGKLQRYQLREKSK